MANRRRLEDGDEVSLSEMVNCRVDEELGGFERAFERLAALQAQEEQDEADRRSEREQRAA